VAWLLSGHIGEDVRAFGFGASPRFVVSETFRLMLRDVADQRGAAGRFRVVGGFLIFEIAADAGCVQRGLWLATCASAVAKSFSSSVFQ
jgi:hypothetical protein